MARAWIEPAYRVIAGKKTEEKMYYVRDRDGSGRKFIIDGGACGSDWDLACKVRDSYNGDKVKLAHGLPLDKKANPITMSEAREKFLSNYTDATLRIYKWGVDKLVPFCGESAQVSAITKDKIIDFRESLRPAHNINGVIDILKYGRAFFSYCVERGWAHQSPARGCLKGLKPKPVAHFLTTEEIHAILKEAGPVEFADIITVALLTGMREDELCNMTGEWIDGDEIEILGKGSKHRRIPVFPGVRSYLEKYKTSPSAQVFQGWSPGRIRQALRRCLGRVRKTMKLPRTRFHDFRHTFASNYLKGGGRIHVLKELLGHSSITTTMQYAHLEKSHLHEEMGKLRADFLKPQLAVVG